MSSALRLTRLNSALEGILGLDAAPRQAGQCSNKGAVTCNRVNIFTVYIGALGSRKGEDG